MQPPFGGPQPVCGPLLSPFRAFLHYKRPIHNFRPLSPGVTQQGECHLTYLLWITWGATKSRGLRQLIHHAAGIGIM